MESERVRSVADWQTGSARASAGERKPRPEKEEKFVYLTLQIIKAAHLISKLQILFIYPQYKIVLPIWRFREIY